METESKLDLSGQCMKRIPRNLSKETASRITELHLDNNEIPCLENINVFSSVVELSASHNAICRMHAVGKLVHLVKLDLSYNHISLVDGLKDLVHLTYLNLANNRIKVVELKTNFRLEHLDLSENFIASVPNLGSLNNLKKLFLHKNAIASLKKSENFLPTSLNTLTLAGNRISDLNEIGHLVNLVQLRDLSIVSNPCVEMTGNSPGFDYRPFLVNWCPSLKCVDGFVVDEIESLKGEWLYSQGRGRKFQFGQHPPLVEYLAETCPLNSQHLQPENERKLRLILSKAHHHQSQLRGTEGKQTRDAQDLMTRSLDPSLLSQCCLIRESLRAERFRTDPLARSLHCERTDLREEPKKECLAEDQNPKDSPPDTTLLDVSTRMTSSSLDGEAIKETAAPLPAASKLVPVPESLISPMVATVPPMTSSGVDAPTEQLSSVKLQSIRNAVKKKRSIEKIPATDKEKAAVCIQKHWRGYHARNLNQVVLSANQKLHNRRIYHHIEKLSKDMEATRGALDNEHKLQVLQMQAINALWRKVASLQPSAMGDSSREVKELTEKCDRLIVQVQQLQSSMQQVLRCVNPPPAATTVSANSATATQTDVVAVHTPQSQLAAAPPPTPPPSVESTDSILFQCRPSSLPLRVHNQVSSECVDGAPDSVDSCIEALGDTQSVVDGSGEPPKQVKSAMVNPSPKPRAPPSEDGAGGPRRCISTFF